MEESFSKKLQKSCPKSSKCSEKHWRFKNKSLCSTPVTVLVGSTAKPVGPLHILSRDLIYIIKPSVWSPWLRFMQSKLYMWDYSYRFLLIVIKDRNWKGKHG